MKMRRLGATGLRISEIGFGGWAIGGNAFGNSYGETDDVASKAALRRALELGVTLFDTADLYGFGHSEALLGEVLKEWRGPKPVVVTKGGVNFYRPDNTLEDDWTPYGIAHAVQQSLNRLRREAIDVYLLMSPPVAELERWRAWQTLDALKRSGKIAHFGVSVAEPEDGVWFLQHNLPIEVIEVAHSIFYQGAAVELLDLARKRKVGILVREPLANGFLTGKYGATAQFAEGDMRGALPPEYACAMSETAKKLDFLQRGGARTMAQAALRFVLDDPRVASVVVGAKTPEQIEENVGAVLAAPIDAVERELIQKVFDQ